MNSLPGSSAADEQASLWAARLEGSTLSAADRDALDAWLKADPAHRVLLSGYCQFSANLEQQLPLLAGIRDELAELPTTAPKTRSLPWLPRPILAGVALTAVAVAGVILWPGRPQDHFQNLTAPVGGRQVATLADGTRLELDAGTALTVELNRDSRRVRLSDGEVFFAVAPDPSRPFFVETPAGSVRVTGTQFNVRTDASSAFEVTVLEGSVQARPGGSGASRSLQPGDQLSGTDGHLAIRRLTEKELAHTLAWRTGHVVFHDTPLGEALRRFARHHGRNLSASPEAAALLVGGQHGLDDLDGFLVTLEDFLPVRVSRSTDGAIRVDLIPR